MKKNFAVIGYGGQGKWHCRQLEGSDVGRLKGIWDIDPEKRAQALEAGFYVYSDLEELLADEQVDVGIVAVPNDDHESLVITLLNAGKNVICEKPVTMTVESFDRMVAASEANNRLFSVMQNRRWDGDFATLKEILHSGQIGKLLNVESRIHGSRGIPGDWRCYKARGGGMLLDWGVHLLDQLLQLTGPNDPVVRIYCDVHNILGYEVDDNFTLRLTFESGAHATVEVGTYNFTTLPRFYMQCEEGGVIFVKGNEEPPVTKLKLWNEKDVTPELIGSGVSKTMAKRDNVTVETYTVPRVPTDVHDYYRNYCAALDGQEEIIVKLPEVRRVVEIMQTALECAETNTIREVRI